MKGQINCPALGLSSSRRQQELKWMSTAERSRSEAGYTLGEVIPLRPRLLHLVVGLSLPQAARSVGVGPRRLPLHRPLIGPVSPTS